MINTVLLPVFVPILSCILLLFFKNNKIITQISLILSSVIQVAFVINIYNSYVYGTLTEISYELLPHLKVLISVDSIGMIFMLLSSGLWCITSLYTIGYVEHNFSDKNPTDFYCFLLLSMFSVSGLAISGNLFTLFIFYELITFCTYPLVAYSCTEEAISSARKYLYILLFSSVTLFLPAIIIIFYLTGSTDFTDGGILSDINVSPMIAKILFAMFIFGIAKTAIMPLHSWLPTAMVAPVPVSALLHAVVVVKAGIFSVIKVVLYIFGINYLQSIFVHWYDYWMIYVAGMTIIIASLYAIQHDGLKSRLAFSTISQLSYMLLAVSLFTASSIDCAVFYMVIHGCAKITLFFIVGLIYTQTGITRVSNLHGLGEVMPIQVFSFIIGAISMIGLPPTATFWGKFWLLTCAWDIKAYFVIGVLIFATVFTSMYFLDLIIIFCSGERNSELEIRSAPLSMILPIICTTCLIIFFFFYPNCILDILYVGR